MVLRQRRGPAVSRAKQLLNRGAAKLGRLGRDNSGTVVVLAGFLFPVVIGGMGLGAETGYWYWTQRKLQHAADVAAHAAGIRNLQGEDENAELKKVAAQVAEKAGFIPGTLALTNPYNGSSDEIEVTLTETPPRLLTSIFTKDPLEISARAVVLVEQGQTACVLALSETASAAVSLQGSTQVTLNGCDVASNSVASDSFSLGGDSAKLTTGCVHSAGGAVYKQGGLNLTTTDEMSPCYDRTPNTYSRSTRDPYADVVEPSFTGLTCEKNKDVGKNNGVTNLLPSILLPNGVKAMCFDNGLHIKGDVKFGPGIYLIRGGDFVLNSSHIVTGTGVTFYLGTGASLSFNGASNADLTAPTSGPYSGILFFGERAESKKGHLLSGDSSGRFTGAVYFPGGQVDYRGSGSSGGGCIQVIGDRVTFGGNATVESDCTAATHGTKDISAGAGVTLIQ